MVWCLIWATEGHCSSEKGCSMAAPCSQMLKAPSSHPSAQLWPLPGPAVPCPDFTLISKKAITGEPIPHPPVSPPQDPPSLLSGKQADTWINFQACSELCFPGENQTDAGNRALNKYFPRKHFIQSLVSPF